jgi:hypothetical protein
MTPEAAMKALKAQHEAMIAKLESALPKMFEIPVDKVLDFHQAPNGDLVGILKSGEQHYQFSITDKEKMLQEVEVKPVS